MPALHRQLRATRSTSAQLGMDSVGKFVEINIACAGAGAAAVVSKEIAFDDHAWTVHCYPRGAPGEAGAGGHLSIHLVNHSNARNAKVLFQAIVLRRDDAIAAASVPSCKNYHATSVFQYPPEGSQRFPWPRFVSLQDLHEHCTVGGYVTVVCGLTVLRHNPIPTPPSTYATDIDGLQLDGKKFGDPDMSFAIEGRTFDVVRSVLAARSPVFRAELEGVAGTTVAESSSSSAVPVIHPEHEFEACTFYAVLLYVYCDRLPRDDECGCPVTINLIRELLAAAHWYKLDRLKLLCAKKLWDDLSVASVSKTLWYADMYNCPQLKKLCMDFLTVGDNFKNTFHTEGFGWLMENSPSMVDEVRRMLFEAAHNDNSGVCSS